MSRLWAITLALALATACSSSGDEDKGEPAPEPPPEPITAPLADAAPPVVKAAPIEYPDGEKGLEQEMNDLLRAVEERESDEAQLARLLESLRLPNYEKWFDITFGKMKAERLAKEYRRVHDNIGLLAELLADIERNGQTNVEVMRFDSEGNDDSVGYQSAAFGFMIKTAPLYSVRFLDSSREKSYHLWSFIHDGTTFRYVGKMKQIGKADYKGETDLMELKLADAARIREAVKNKRNR